MRYEYLLQEIESLKNWVRRLRLVILAMCVVVVLLLCGITVGFSNINSKLASSTPDGEAQEVQKEETTLKKATDNNDFIDGVRQPSERELGEWREFEATAYCGCQLCNEAWSDGSRAVSATGAELVSNCSIAADFDVLPPFTQVEISGMGIYTVHDCGGAIKGNRIDIYFDNHEDAMDFGVQKIYLRVCDNEN